jgi:hypothetical protein
LGFLPIKGSSGSAGKILVHIFSRHSRGSFGGFEILHSNRNAGAGVGKEKGRCPDGLNVFLDAILSPQNLEYTTVDDFR